MRETLEIVTALLMQNMVQIREKNTYFVTELFFELFEKVIFGLSALRAPTGGAIRLLVSFCTYALYFLLASPQTSSLDSTGLSSPEAINIMACVKRHAWLGYISDILFKTLKRPRHSKLCVICFSKLSLFGFIPLFEGLST